MEKNYFVVSKTEKNVLLVHNFRNSKIDILKNIFKYIKNINKEKEMGERILTSLGNKLKENEDKFIEIIKKGKTDDLEEMKILTLFSFDIIVFIKEEKNDLNEEVIYELFSNKFYKYLYENEDICEKILKLFKKEEKELSLTLYIIVEDIKLIKEEHINGNIYHRGKNLILKLFSENLLDENFVYSSFMCEKDILYFESIKSIYECFHKFCNENKIKLFKEICESIFGEEAVTFDNEEIIDILCELIDILNRENITIIWNETEEFNLYIIKNFTDYENLYDNEKVLKIMRFCFSKFSFNYIKSNWKKEEQLIKSVNYCKKLFEGKDFEFNYIYDEDYNYSPFLEDNYFLQYIKCEKLCDEQLNKIYEKYGYFKEEYEKRNLNDNILEY